MSKQFHVWITASGEYKVLETTGANTAQEVNERLPSPHLGWYGCEATSPEEAVEIAKAAGLEYSPPEKMKALNARIQEFKQD